MLRPDGESATTHLKRNWTLLWAGRRHLEAVLIGSDRLLVLTVFEGHRMFPEDVVAPEADC